MADDLQRLLAEAVRTPGEGTTMATKKASKKLRKAKSMKKVKTARRTGVPAIQ